MLTSVKHYRLASLAAARHARCQSPTAFDALSTADPEERYARSGQRRGRADGIRGKPAKCHYQLSGQSTAHVAREESAPVVPLYAHVSEFKPSASLPQARVQTNEKAKLTPPTFFDDFPRNPNSNSIVNHTSNIALLILLFQSGAKKTGDVGFEPVVNKEVSALCIFHSLRNG